jgi:hypothetical protein
LFTPPSSTSHRSIFDDYIAASLTRCWPTLNIAVLPIEAFYFRYFHFNLSFPQQDRYLAERHVTVIVPKAAFAGGCVRHGAPFKPDCAQQQAPSTYLCCHLGRSI